MSSESPHTPSLLTSNIAQCVLQQRLGIVPLPAVLKREPNDSRYFKPQTTRKHGTLQDPGLQANNPILIAMSEFQSLWPAQRTPDFILSLGTGFEEGDKDEPTRSPVRLRFWKRILQELTIATKGSKLAQDWESAMPSEWRSRYNRLDMAYEVEPPLDNFAAIEPLKPLVSDWLQGNEQVKDVWELMLVSNFYFELDDYPFFEDGRFHCTGKILCRLPMSERGFETLQKVLRETHSFFLVGGHPVKSFDSASSTEGLTTGTSQSTIDGGLVRCVDQASAMSLPFMKHISFTTGSLDSTLDISLIGLTSKRRPISGTPKKLIDFITARKLDAPFGTIEHTQKSKTLPPLPLRTRYRD